MKKWFIRGFILAVVFLTVFAAAGCSSSKRYVAKVGTEKITEAEFKIILGVTKAQFSEMMGITDWDAKLDEGTIGDFVKQSALERAHEYKVELIKAQESGIKLTNEEKKQVREDLDAQIESWGGRSEANKMLRDIYGVTLGDYEKFFMDNVITEKFRASQLENINFSDEELKKEYESKKDEYDYVSVRHILFRTMDDEGKDLPEEKVKEAENKANDVLNRIKAGEKMEDLVEEFSEDPSKIENKGVFTFSITGQLLTSNDRLVEEFPEWAFKAEVGDVDVIRTEFGYHVVKLEKRTTFEELKEQLRAYLQNMKYFTEYLQKWVEESKYKLEKNEKVYNSIKL